MRAGRLPHLVLLQSATEACDTHGEPVQTWATVAAVWAGIEPLRGKELEESNQIVTENLVRIVIRYRRDVTAKWRVLYAGRVFEILSVKNLNTRNRELHLMSRETV